MTMSGDPFSISKREYTTKRGYNAARNQKTGDAAAVAGSAGLVGGGVADYQAGKAGSKVAGSGGGIKDSFKGQRQMKTGRLKSIGAAARTAPAAIKGARPHGGVMAAGAYGGALAGMSIGARQGSKRAGKKFDDKNKLVTKSSTSAFGVKH